MHGHSAGKIKNTMYDKNCETGHQSWAMGFTKQNLESSPHLNFISLWRIFLLFFSFLSDNYIISIPFGKYTANWNGWKWGGELTWPHQEQCIRVWTALILVQCCKKKKKKKKGKKVMSDGHNSDPIHRLSTSRANPPSIHPSIHSSIHWSIHPMHHSTVLLNYHIFLFKCAPADCLSTLITPQSRN